MEQLFAGWEVWLLRAAAISAAIGVLWRMWGKPTKDRIVQALDEHHAIVTLLSTEFQTNGGSTIKDAILALLEGQRQMGVWMEWHNRQWPDGHSTGAPIAGGVGEPPPVVKVGK